MSQQKDDSGPICPPAEAVARDWVRTLAPYRETRRARSLVELLITVVPFVALWVAMWLTIDHAYWLSLLLALPTAGFLVRLFMIQHDCGHGSFFGRRWADDWLGRLLGVATLTPYDHWRSKHAVHHATAGHLDRRGVGDIDTLTVREFRGLPARRQLIYRLGRSPFVILGLAPLYLFVLRYRLPGDFADPWSAWFGTMATNVAILAIVTLMIMSVGALDFLLVQGPVTLLASTAGVWLFYVQHQFEHTFWQSGRSWNFHESALHSSSFLDLPPVLRWFTANIGVHHVHHLCSRIPSYRLGEVLRDHPQLGKINRLSFREACASLRLALWDEERGAMVSFRQSRLNQRLIVA